MQYRWFLGFAMSRSGCGCISNYEIVWSCGALWRLLLVTLLSLGEHVDLLKVQGGAEKKVREGGRGFPVAEVAGVAARKATHAV